MTAVSVDPVAPGLAELMLGEASFSQMITRDRLSRVHLVSAGRPGFDRALLQSPRLTLAIDALLRVYDHVLLDAGAASDLPAELLTAQARAVVVPDAVDERGRARADVRSAHRRWASPSDDAEQSRRSRRMPSNPVRGWWRPERPAADRLAETVLSVKRAAQLCAICSSAGLCFTRCLARLIADIAAAASLPRGAERR